MSTVNSDQPHRRFNFVYSCDVDVNFRIKIGTLEGEREKPSYRALIDDLLLKYSGVSQDGCSDLYVTCQIFSDGKELSLPIQTSYKAFNEKWNWNECLILPVKFSDLPRNSVLAFTVWDIHKPRQATPVGGTSVHIFGKYGALRQGIHDLRLWHNTEADGNFCSKTPGKMDCSKEQMLKLVKLTKKHRNGHMIKVDWLDRLTFREIEMINEKEKRSSNYMYLMIEFPKIVVHGTDYTVVYFEKDGCIECHQDLHTDIATVPDPEIPMQNLVEAKHHKLFRGIHSGLSDKDLKPNAATRDQLNAIISYPPIKSLSSEEQDLVWKFRFYLTDKEKALSKFLKCVNWKIPVEAEQALDMLKQFKAMDVEDALELLSPQYTHSAVRRYAVTRLQQAPDEDLLMYLMQLVQALKYENFDEIRAAGVDVRKDDSFSRSAESENSTEKGRSRSLSSEKQSRSDTFLGNLKDPSTGCHQDFSVKQELPSTNECDLATFLINRAAANDTLANYFYWYLAVECEEQVNTAEDSKGTIQMYVTVLKRFSQVLLKGSQELKQRREWLVRQRHFVDRLVKVMIAVGKESGNRNKKIEKLKDLLFDTESNKINFTSFDSFPLPLDPTVKVKGIIPDKATLFNSAMMPCRLTFLTSENTEYVTIFKHGDDLRQDQLVIQTIMLMDKLLKRENLDLKMTPYRVLASSYKHGFLQYVESISIDQVLQQEGSIQGYFRKCAPSENGPYGIAAEVMDTYVKSCAGYCVITYLLGVGDRHLDNLLLTKTGKLLHIDFGYILGRDPKPLPPPMKLSKEMVEAMGGEKSDHYQDFCKQCYTAFLCLRRHANLFLNLFSLMVDANIPDIALEPDKTVKKVKDKFRLDLPDDEADHYVQSLIDDSVKAVMAVVVDQFHRLAQYWRR